MQIIKIEFIPNRNQSASLNPFKKPQARFHPHDIK